MAKMQNRGRQLQVSEMISLEGIYRAGASENVMRLWRAYHGLSQAAVAEKLEVHQMAISALERWGLRSLSGSYGAKYGESVQKAVDRLAQAGITTEMLGLQFEGLPTRFSKKPGTE